MLKIKLSIFFLFFYLGSYCQKMTPIEYVEKYKEIAINEMKRMGIPAAITLAQGILETESGNSELSQKSNNHFGIKCKNSWSGQSVSHNDDAHGECFRSYKTVEDSYRDHSNFLRGNQRYRFLFNLNVTDYKAWAQGLKDAGYATNPNYPTILIKNIEQYNLQQYTLIAASEVPVYDASKYQDDVEEITVDTMLSKNKFSETLLDEEDKIFTINNTKCVLGKKGVSLLVIATKNKIDIEKLLLFNELAEDGILPKNQYIFLQKKPKKGKTKYYTSLEGETLFDIAQKNGIQLQYLKDYNNFTENDVLPIVGTKILLQPN